MSDETLPSELRDLIRRHIESIDHMEMLLLLHRSVPRAWSADAIAHELHLPLATTGPCLDALVRSGLAVATRPTLGETGALLYRYAPGSDALARGVNALATEYEERPVVLVTAVRSRPSVALQSFSDAFRVRRRT